MKTLNLVESSENVLSGDEIRALGRSERSERSERRGLSRATIEKWRAFVASYSRFRRTGSSQRLASKRAENWRDAGSKRRAKSVGAEVCWLVLPSGEISPPNGGQPILENVTAREVARKLIPAPAGFIGAPADPNIGKKPEPRFARYLYHTDKTSRKVRVARRDNGAPIVVRETEREILRRRAEHEIVRPYFTEAKQHRQAKRRGEAHDTRLAALCERLPPSPIISRAVREDDRIDLNKEQPELSGVALRFLVTLQNKLGKRDGFLVFDSLRCGLSIRKSADGICAESSLRRWIGQATK